MKPKPYLLIAVIMTSSLLNGCAGQKPAPTFVAAPPKPKSGEQMLQESQRMQQLGQRWIEGQKMVKQGEEIVQQGQLKIEEGQRMIEEGKRIMKESEEGSGTVK